ncbi:uncharacterized protein LOC142167225 [Nicotiana tabacum]|uniref:Uncharacterized protein LOC142167225 n=1 Tax=Nicotiana tabacum TaxID=4097 RepID=A0AC58SET5_TOBAC
MPTGKLAKWQILLSEFDIVYITQKAIKGQALADHLAESPVNKDYEPLTIYFPGEEHYPASAKIRFPCTNNMVEYEACILGIRMAVDRNIKELFIIVNSDLLIHQVNEEWSTKNIKILPYLHCVKELCMKYTKIEFKHVPRIQNEFSNALATLSSMIQHPDKNYIDPIEVGIRDQHAYYFHVDEEPDDTWYRDIKRFLEASEYLESATNSQKWGIIRLANHFFLNGEVLYRRTPDLGLLRCVDAVEATRLLEEIHTGMIPQSIIIDNEDNLNSDLMREICEKFRIVNRISTAYRPQMNGAVEADNKNIKRILRKIVDNHSQWHEKLSFALLGYQSNMRTSTGATPHMLVYGTEAVIPAEVEISCLRVLRQMVRTSTADVPGGGGAALPVARGRGRAPAPARG